LLNIVSFIQQAREHMPGGLAPANGKSDIVGYQGIDVERYLDDGAVLGRTVSP